MMNAVRSGAGSTIVKFVTFGLLLMAVAGLALTGGFRFGGMKQTAVARIGGDELSLMEFDGILRRTLARQGLDIDTAYKLGFVTRVLEGEIANNLIHRAAIDMGIRASDADVMKQIDRLVTPLVTEEMDKKSVLAAVIRNQGMTEQGFVRMVRAEMAGNLLRNAVQTGTAVPSEALARDLYEFGAEERTAQIIYLPHSGVKEVKDPADEILTAFYQAGKERYALPETRSFSVAILSGDKLEKTLDITDEELRETYEKDKDSYVQPERRVIRQAVFDDKDAAEKAAASVKAGKSLKEAAGDNDRGEEEYEKNGLPAAIAEPAFAAAKGDIVGPLETALGWHVLQIANIRAPHTKSFEEVKPDLKKDLVHMRAADQLYAMGNELDDSLAGGATLEEAAGAMDLEINSYGPVRHDGSTPEDKDGLDESLAADRATVLETVFGLEEGESAPVMELADGRFAAIRLDTLTEKSWRPFEEVRGDLAKVWIQDQKEVANKLRAQDALKELQSGDKTLDQETAALGGSVRAEKLARAKDPQEPLTGASLAAIFSGEKDAFIMAPAKDGYILARIDAITLPDAAKAEESKITPFAESVQRAEQDELAQLYFRHLESGYAVMVNQRLIDTTYGPGNEQPQ